jgi:hypothetical protein
LYAAISHELGFHFIDHQPLTIEPADWPAADHAAASVALSPGLPLSKLGHATSKSALSGDDEHGNEDASPYLTLSPPRGAIESHGWSLRRCGGGGRGRKRRRSCA